MSEKTEGHTLRRYDGELNHIHYLALEMGGLALNQVEQALTSLKTRDLALARKVIQRDNEVDALEVRADGEIAKVVARRSPVATDLRMVLAVSKSITDLERVGDEAVKIANIVLHVYDNESADPNSQLLRDVTRMGAMAITMLQEALDLFDRQDEEKAEKIARGHSELDEEFKSGLRRLITYIMEDARNIGFAVSAVLIIKALERIGDHAKNMAEYVIFRIKGEDIRHSSAANR
jgi:phosphate transport system protein